jgi:hypothetical protein
LASQILFVKGLGISVEALPQGPFRRNVLDAQRFPEPIIVCQSCRRFQIPFRLPQKPQIRYVPMQNPRSLENPLVQNLTQARRFEILLLGFYKQSLYSLNNI